MALKTYIKQMLNVKHTVIKNFKYNKNSDELTISVRPTKGHALLCPECMKRCTQYDSLGIRRWRSLDMGTTKVFLECPVVRTSCKEHGILTAFVPWARHNSSFTRDFENNVVWMTKYLPKTAVSKMQRISWNTIGPIISRFRKDADPEPNHRFENLKRIGIDETSYKKGHKYLTVIVNHDTNSVIWVHDKHGKEVLREFFKLLTDEQRNSIECVSADGARWISETLDEFIPNAARCLDTYHMTEWAMEAVDQVRLDAWNRAKEKIKEKRKVGRPRKGQEIDKTAEKIKHTKIALGKASEHLTDYQKQQLNFIASIDNKLYKAYVLKEQLRTLVKLPYEEVEEQLKDWLWKASHSQIPSMYELQKKIRRHKEAILNTAKYQLSNARIEATNNKIKLTIRMAYGFRSIDNLIDMIFLRCSDIPCYLPWEYKKDPSLVLTC